MEGIKNERMNERRDEGTKGRRVRSHSGTGAGGETQSLTLAKSINYSNF